jgi:D-methionine transport system substrate-binding protein
MTLHFTRSGPALLARLIVAVLLVSLVISVTPVSAASTTLKLGVTAGPHEELAEVVKKILAKEGVDLKSVVFTDYVTPNLALAEGDLDANSFQHKPYLDSFVADRKLDLVWAAPNVIFPMGIYSKKVKSLRDLKTGATIAIPNDPTNGGRALLLLEAAGLLKLKKDAGLKATVFDIVSNPKNLKIKELDAAQLPRSLQDVDAATVNTNYAMEAKLSPLKDAIYLEDPDSPYVNGIVVRSKDKEDPLIKKLVKAYQSPEVAKFIQDRYDGSVIVGWK